ncbi:TniB family NTP-binding protein [Paraburkholderia sp. NMBU_R16]|uniref:TniB family NTP-binding protein n=1 Tax=Paraburkholderia sp. NMBU_R16 TaxID=2698676 RepID=UPI0020B6A08C|nr:TniB family NTP-binding protein [Paraburkholderia sp. NMBU_R16]
MRSQAQLDDAARIHCLLRDRWIDYPRATQALEQLERLFATPRRERIDGAPRRGGPPKRNRFA